MGRMIQAIYNIADKKHAERIQHKVQKKRAKGSNKSFKELIEEEIQKELSIDPIEEG
jgi:myosin-crossreactive antigen